MFKNVRLIGMLCLLLTFTLCFSACDPLRKKFIRQKKKADTSNDIMPVLEPVEYLPPENNPEQNYTQHYSLIKVWEKDLMSAVDTQESDKRQQYLLNQIYSHITEMQRLVNEEGQKSLTGLSDLLKYYNNSLRQPQHMRNKSRLQSDLRAFDRVLRDRCRPEKMKDRFVKPQS